jgi:hypothetical protein
MATQARNLTLVKINEYKAEVFVVGICCNAQPDANHLSCEGYQLLITFEKCRSSGGHLGCHFAMVTESCIVASHICAP